MRGSVRWRGCRRRLLRQQTLQGVDVALPEVVHALQHGRPCFLQVKVTVGTALLFQGIDCVGLCGHHRGIIQAFSQAPRHGIQFLVHGVEFFRADALGKFADAALTTVIGRRQNIDRKSQFRRIQRRHPG